MSGRAATTIHRILNGLQFDLGLLRLSQVNRETSRAKAMNAIHKQHSKKCAAEAKHEDTKNQPEVHPAAEQAADGLPPQTLHRD